MYHGLWLVIVDIVSVSILLHQLLSLSFFNAILHFFRNSWVFFVGHTKKEASP